MAQKVLDATIRLLGKTMPSFLQLGQRIEGIGSQIDRVGQKIWELEKESVTVYRNYDDYMRDVRATYIKSYDSMTEYEKAMRSLEDYAAKWASSSIFHTNDVAKAMSEAANAGWDYNEMIKGIPQAMLIAQAGGMDLSTALNYLVKMVGSTGSSFDDINRIINEWSAASKSSATTIDEMGDAFRTLGAAAQFGDSTAELFALLSVLANVGTVGSSAGTQLRSVIMRLIAPTKKASDMMELLGADSEDLAEIMADGELSDATKELEKLGFSVYDDAGRLKPLITIFKDLNKALDGMDEHTRNTTLSAIFPTRTISAATAFLTAIENGDLQELEGILANSSGYVEQIAKIKMGGITGDVETLKSKWEEFERGVGETLAPSIGKAADKIGEFIDGLNSMDEGKLSTLVGGLTGLAATGTGMTVLGAAITTIGKLGWAGLAMAAIGVGAGALAGHIAYLDEVSTSENFGTMELNLTSLGEAVNGIGNKFNETNTRISEFETALQEVQAKYETTSSAMSEKLLEKVIGGGTVTDAEKKTLQDYADAIVQNIEDGIVLSKARNLTLLEALFGDGKTGSKEEKVYTTSVLLMEERFSGLYDEAQELGAKLREQMTEALRDKSLNDSEREAISATQKRLNEIMSEISSYENKSAYYTQLYKSQQVSWDTLSDFMKENREKQETTLAEAEAMFAENYGRMAAYYEWGIKNGVVKKEDWEAYQEEFENNRKEYMDSIIAQFAEPSARAFDAAMKGSEWADAWAFLKQVDELGEKAFDKNGNLDFAALGMNAEKAIKIAEQLTDLANTDTNWTGFGKGKITNVLSPFKDNPIIAGYLQMLEGGFGYGSELTGRYNQYYDYLKNGTLPPEIAGKDEQILAAQGMLAMQQAQYEDLKGQYDTLQQNIRIAEAAIRDYMSNPSRKEGESERDFLMRQGFAFQSIDNLVDYKQREPELRLKTDQAAAAVETLEAKIDGLTKDREMTLKLFLETGTLDEFAEGGRATQASIFGEGGPEWAIPEEHSERTARLLDEARRASGFTWGDLLSRYGGLNAGTGGSVTVNYAPVITAGNAEGIDSVLAADKERLKRVIAEAMREQKFLDRMTVYA